GQAVIVGHVADRDLVRERQRVVVHESHGQAGFGELLQGIRDGVVVVQLGKAREVGLDRRDLSARLREQLLGPRELTAVDGADGGARVPHQQARVRQRALARGVLGGEVRVGQLLELLYSVHEVSIWCYNFYTATARLCA